MLKENFVNVHLKETFLETKNKHTHLENLKKSRTHFESLNNHIGVQKPSEKIPEAMLAIEEPLFLSV